MKNYLPKFQNEFSDIKEQLEELFDELDILNIQLNKKVPKTLKTKLDRKVKQWKKLGLITGYFRYLVLYNKYTYLDVIRLFIYGIYAEKELEFKTYSLDIFHKVANDCFEQAKQESKLKPNYETFNDDLIWSWVFVTTAGLSYVEYLKLLSQTSVEESLKVFTNAINQKLDSINLDKTIKKQSNRLLCINENKYSGIVETEAISCGNKAYYKPFPNQKVLFIAVMDDRTTDMCKSMDGMIFNTYDKNSFDRYSASEQGLKRYEIEGLIDGINCPPITDGFHWCRSTLAYLSFGDTRINML